jgi:hypothetical protein
LQEDRISAPHGLEPVFNLFFGLLYNRNIELDVRFLLYAQAVETYGYRRGRKPVERSFRDQARDVLASCSTVSRKIVGDDLDAFTAHLKVTRDFYTHYNPAKNPRPRRVSAYSSSPFNYPRL